MPREYDFSASPSRPCDAPLCLKEGTYRAPQSPQNLSTYFWFCLPHVRDYNKGWNYYSGMGSEEIEKLNRHDLGWQRTTWPLGSRTATGSIHNRSERLEAAYREAFSCNKEASPSARQLGLFTAEERQAIQVLDLAPPLTHAALKARYKALVKTHHPDHHGGSKKAEEMFKNISAAYRLLKKHPHIK